MSYYFVIECSEDGTSIRTMTRDQLDRELKDRAGNVEFLDKAPSFDGFSWNASDRALFIIKGEVVVPTPTERVVAYEIP